MGNYKPYATDYFIIGEYVRAVKSGQTPKQFSLPVNPTTTGVSYHDSADANYQVPTGKKLVIVGFILAESTVGRVLTIFQSDAADASTNPVNKFVVTTGTTNLAIPIPMLDLPVILAEKYLNLKTSNTTTTPTILVVFGYEESA